jgi:hypothetical protein
MKIVLAAALLAATPAFAEPTIELVPTCVAIDSAHDELPAAQREHARLLLVRALERQDQLIVEAGCQETIELSHQRDGANVVVRIAGPRARRKLTVSAQEDMLEIYRRMTKSLLEASVPASEPAPRAQPRPVEAPAVAEAPSAEPGSVEAPAVAEAPSTTPAMVDGFDDAPTRTPALGDPSDTPSAEGSEDAVPTRQRLWYTRFGFASIGGMGGISFVTGWRRGSRANVVDVGFAFVAGDGDPGNSASSASVRVQGLHYASPASRSSAYLGGGGSLGITSIDVQRYGELPMQESGGGVQLEGTLGYEWNRTGSHRFSVEANLGLPLYNIGETYPVAFVASFGIGM